MIRHSDTGDYFSTVLRKRRKVVLDGVPSHRSIYYTAIDVAYSIPIIDRVFSFFINATGSGKLPL